MDQGRRRGAAPRKPMPCGRRRNAASGAQIVLFGSDAAEFQYNERWRVYIHENNGIRMGTADNFFTISVDHQRMLTARMDGEVVAAHTRSKPIVTSPSRWCATIITWRRSSRGSDRRSRRHSGCICATCGWPAFRPTRPLLQGTDRPKIKQMLRLAACDERRAASRYDGRCEDGSDRRDLVETGTPAARAACTVIPSAVVEFGRSIGAQR